MTLATFFDHVVHNDNAAAMDYLASHKGKTRIKQLAMVYAAALGNYELVKHMLARGMNANIYDVLTDFTRTWEPRKLKQIQAAISNDMRRFTRGWATVLTPACAAAFYGHKRVLSLLCEHDFSTMSFNPYSAMTSAFIGNGTPPEWNATTCGLFGQQWDIASTLVDMGVKTTDMHEQYPAFLQFRTKTHLPKDVINIVFSFF